MRLAAILVLGSLMSTAPPTLAAGPDFEIGSFNGRWCNYYATYNVEQEDPDFWVFYGKLKLHSTGQNDSIKISQLADNSLRIVRNQPGVSPDKIQWAKLAVVGLSGGYYTFYGPAYGEGCSGLMAYLYFPAP